MATDTNSYTTSPEFRPFVYDPATNPEYFEGVRTRRVFAFLIDALIISAPVVLAGIAILLLSVVTFGLGLILFWPLQIGAVIWAILYYGFTLGSSSSATVGMRVMGIEMRTWYGAPCYFVLGAVHAVFYWVSVSMLTPLVLLVSLFNLRKRLLHDMVLGTVVINSPVRANQLQRRR